MALTNEQSKALAEDIVSNLDRYTVNRSDKLELSLKYHEELRLEEKRAAAERRKAAMSQTFDSNGLIENNRGYGQGRKMGD